MQTRTLAESIYAGFEIYSFSMLVKK